MIKKIIAIFMAIMMVFGTIPIDVFASNSKEPAKFEDMPENWSRAALENAVENGLLSGVDGKIMPNEKLTRAQMATVITRAFGAKDKGNISKFSDVKASDWFYDSMSKAYKMGVIKGSNNKLNPKEPITRQEAFVMIARAFKLESADVLNKSFEDTDQISDWAKEEVYSVINNGYIQGSNGKINPKGNITRAEFAQVFYNIVKEYIQTEGTYKNFAKGNIMVSVPNVILKDLTIEGDLIIGDGVGEGDVTLDNVKVRGRMVVRGGGENSIIIKGNSDISNIIVAKVDGVVSIKVQGDANVEIIYIDDESDDVNIEGQIGNLQVIASGIIVSAIDSQIKTIDIIGKNSKVIIDKDSKVENININKEAVGIKLEVVGIVDKVTTQAPNTQITGKGKVSKVEVKEGGNNAKIETTNTKVQVDKGVTGVTLPPTPPSPSSSGGSSSGGSSSGGTTVVSVSAITVTGADTVVNGKTLQMGVDITPTTATNKKVTWSVTDGTGSAIISTSGLLTATGVGTVTVKALAQDGSGEEGTKEITIKPNDADKVATAKANLGIGYLNDIVEDLTLPTTQDDATVLWASSNEGVIATDGTVVRPENSDGNATVTLTATLKVGSATDTKVFVAIVKAKATTQHTLTLTGDNISSTPGAGKIDDNTEVTISVTPVAGKQVATFTVDGVDKKADLTAEGKYIFNITTDTEVKVTYEDIMLVLTLTGDGLTSNQTDNSSIKYGTSVTVTVTPATGKQVASFKVDGVDKKAGLTAEGTYAFTITADTEVVVTYDDIIVTGVTIKTLPTKVTYTEGETLSLAGLEVTLTKSDTTTEDVAFADFSSKGLTTSLADGTNLTVASHNGTKITITHTVSSESAETDALTVNAALSDSKAITSFKLETLSPAVTGVIDEGSKTIALRVAHDTDVTALVPTIGHTGASISPDTEIAQNFESPVTYTVTAENSSTADYVVTVTVAPADSFILTYTAGTGGTITGTSPQTVLSGGDGTTVKAIANEGYSFDKWSDDLATAERTDKNVTANITVTAQFEINKYTVTFVDHDDSVLKTEEVEEGKSATVPADPTRAGYTFTGWDVDFSNVTSDLTVKAQYNINKYTITFNSDGGSTVASITQDYGTAITPPANPTKTGYTFANWNPSLPVTMPANDLTVTAQYTKDALALTVPTVTSDLQEGKTNVAVGAEIIASLTATGGDSSYTYSLEGTDAAKFEIDSSTGKVTVKDNPLTEKTYSITVKVTDGASATAEQAVSVLVAAPDVVLGAPVTGLEVVLQMGATETATASTTEAGAGGWTSSDPSVATVDASTGVVTALKAGTTTIAYTASTSGNVNSKEITVYAATFTSQTDNSISNDVATLGLVGNQVSSSSSSVATGAIESGKIKITSLAQGSTTITVKSDLNYETNIAVTVAVDGTITIGAITKPALKVTYNINGGSGTVPTQASLTSGDTFTVAYPTGLTAPAGKQFREWNTTGNGAGTGYAPGDTITMETSHVILYAIWEDIYTVKFVAGENGSLTGTTEFVDIINGTAWKTAVTVPALVAHPGFKFKDWTPTFPATVNKNATYTANFVALSTDASLSDLTVDGTSVTDFDADILIYNVELPIGTINVPAVGATANNIKATIEITQASTVTGSATIVVTAEDGTTQTYIINFTVAADTTAPVITASDETVAIANLATWTKTVSATDDVDGDVTAYVVATYFKSDGTTSLTDLAAAKEYIGDASVNTSFIIKYNVSDAAGNPATEVVVTITVAKANIPSSVTVDSSTLNSTNPYLVDGKPATTGTLGAGNCTAHFDPITGDLSLEDYSGGGIRINEADKDLSIKLIGNDNKITCGQFGIYNGYGDIDITSDTEASLEIYQTSPGAGAAIVTGFQGFGTGSVFIGGKVRLTIEGKYTGEEINEAVTGIHAGRGSVTIQDQADYSATLTNSKYQGRGILSDGKTIINTSGNIEIDVSNSVQGIGIHGYGGIDINKVNSMLIKTSTDDGTFTNKEPDLSSGVAINKSTTKASYRSGTPYTLGLEGGNITSAKGGVIGSPHQYLVGDEITIESTISEFDRWTKADGTALEESLFIDSTNANSATAKIKMPAGSLSIKAREKETGTIINIAAIPGVTAPVKGATPVTKITETAQYTGTVTWSPIATKFAGGTVYTATITLKAKPEFKLDGVAANFFKVEGATTVTNEADTGEITAVFPATEADTLINIAAIPGVVAPVTGKTPVTTSINTTQYTGTVTWTPEDNPFAAETVYKATIKLTAKTGFTLDGVIANFFTVNGIATTHVAGVVTVEFPATAAFGFAGGTGTLGDPYKVATAEQLNKVREYMGSGIYFKQTANIDLSDYLALGGAGYNEGKGWVPIGSSESSPFKGTYDGNNFNISNLTINRPDAKGQGLFGYGGQHTNLKNINLLEVNIKGESFVGGLIGNFGFGQLENCHVSGKVEGTGDFVGGLAGLYNNSDVGKGMKKCSTSVEVIGINYVGGLAGKSGWTTIDSCYSKGSVTGVDIVGGLVGSVESNLNVKVTNSYSLASVEATGINGRVGGLVGLNWKAIENCYAAGQVTGNGTNAGGLVGENKGTGTINLSYYDSTTTEQNDTGKGDGKTTDEMQTATPFTGWDETIWKFEVGNYPTLK